MSPSRQVKRHLVPPQKGYSVRTSCNVEGIVLTFRIVAIHVGNGAPAGNDESARTAANLSLEYIIE